MANGYMVESLPAFLFLIQFCGKSFANFISGIEKRFFQ